MRQNREVPVIGTSPRDRRRNKAVYVAVAFALLTGCANPAVQPDTAAGSSPSATAAKSGTASAPDAVRELQPSVAGRPASVVITEIGVDSSLIDLGLNPDGTIEVPPTEPGSPAGWYVGSPVPGQLGPSVLLGHVNATDGGPGVFARLRELSAGDVISVRQTDGSTAVFSFVRGEQYSKSNFPSDLVYGNTAGPELRLITCDGFNSDSGEFEDNYVVFAELADTLG
ncbi:sortase [Arthrobacter sp. zg-Y40]|uniref:class F sortase n=1 Tax=Arthrobacter sp. zg-Y40 TaxID=2886939 RepID=UPI001D1421AF|nr:class F sortase [Arthrobacter sp. zg-Y40]MCC3279873.1 sortase [Arthrobacter sp. zg-Y40]